MPANTVLLCCAFLVLLYAALSINVSRVRIQGRESPRVTEAQLTQAIRAHGNAAEYIPLIVALLLYLHMAAPSPFVSAVALVATASRVVHAAGMLFAHGLRGRHALRFIGALGTYASLVALGIALLRQVL
ncbi:MAG TPA: MAPEG family protein [Rhizobacter sp.]|nr:MAPEG family protein [Rhizobacter sp.]